MGERWYKNVDTNATNTNTEVQCQTFLKLSPSPQNSVTKNKSYNFVILNRANPSCWLNWIIGRNRFRVYACVCVCVCGWVWKRESERARERERERQRERLEEREKTFSNLTRFERGTKNIVWLPIGTESWLIQISCCLICLCCHYCHFCPKSHFCLNWLNQCPVVQKFK